MTDVSSQRDLLRLLKDNPGRRFTSFEIADRLGWTGSDESCRRRVHQTVNELRHEGEPICSASEKNSGYWYPKTREEALEGYHILHERVIHQEQTLNRMKKAIDSKFPEKVLQTKMSFGGF